MYDPATDLAVLRVVGDHVLPSVSWGDSDVARVGDWVVAIGNPFGLGQTLTVGVISARNRDIQAGSYDDFIQTDAAINRGNSGGPLFNLDGQVIGVNSAILSPTGGSVGIGFSIPSELAISIVNQLLEYGETRRGWLGVNIQAVSPELAETFGLDHTYGAVIRRVTEDGPAADAGLEQGVESGEQRRVPAQVARVALEILEVQRLLLVTLDTRESDPEQAECSV